MSIATSNVVKRAGVPRPGLQSGVLCDERHPNRRLLSASVAKRYKEVRQALVAAGWRVVRQRGSHEVWAHPDREQRIVVAGKESDTVPIGTLGSIRRASGLEHLR